MEKMEKMNEDDRVLFAHWAKKLACAVESHGIFDNTDAIKEASKQVMRHLSKLGIY